MKNNKQYDLFRMLLNSIWAEILALFVRDATPTFPSNIGNYVFIKPFKKIGPRKSYLLAIYQNKKGKKAIAKMKSSKIKGYHYHSLLNEINLYKILNSAIRRIKKDIPSKYKNLYIPQLITSYEDKEILLSLVEFVDGEVADSYNAKDKIKLYIKITDFFNYLGQRLTAEERNQISVRKSINYIALYPFLVIKAIITYPLSIKYVLMGMVKFFRYIPIMMKESKESLIHRDLHFKNILKGENGYVLIDFQQMVLSEPLHEMITTLRYFWNGKQGREFGRLLLGAIVKKYSKRKKFNELFQSYAINSVTHGLTGSGFPKEMISSWLDFLKFSLNPDFTKYQSKNYI